MVLGTPVLLASGFLHYHTLILGSFAFPRCFSASVVDYSAYSDMWYQSNCIVKKLKQLIDSFLHRFL